MLISRNHLATSVSRFLEVLDEHQIDGLRAIKAAVGSSWSYREMLPEQVTLEHTRTLRGHPYILSYVSSGFEGILLDVRLHESLGVTGIIIKSRDSIQGYIPFASDSYGNRAQSKVLHTIDWRDVRKELDALTQR